MVTAGQETTGGMVETEMGDERKLRRPCCKCHYVPFNTSHYVAVDIQDGTAAVIS